jgi:lipopolysaccharide export system protein LptC
MIVARMPVRGSTSSASIARRRVMVGIAKLLLPATALALLVLLVIWPELYRDTDSGRLSYRRLTVLPESGELSDPRYRGVDSGGRPYTITATRARQIGQNRTDLVEPIADMTTESGAWVMLRASQGVYLPKDGQLDLAGEVTLYREDGMTVSTDTATFDLNEGVGSGAARIHAEGPFGALDAQGFAVVDKGAVMQFTGPGRLLLNEGNK